MQKPPSPSAGFIDFSKATSSSSLRRPYLGRNGAPDKQSQIARWNQPFPALVGAAVKASALSKCQWCHCWVWQPFDLLTFRHSTAVAVLPNNGCLRIEVDLLFRVSSRIWSVSFARWPEAVRIIISNLTLSLLRSGRPKWPPVENYLHLSLVTWVQFSVANYLLFNKKRWTQRDLFRVISFVKKKKKHRKFQCQHAYFKVSCDIPLGNHIKNRVCFIKFYTLNVWRARNTSPFELFLVHARQSSWRLTSMSRHILDRLAHVCVCKSLIAWECEILARLLSAPGSDFCFRFAKQKPR